MCVVCCLGYFHVGYNQELVVNATDYDVPFNAHVYEKGHITYPARNFFYKTKLFSSGKVLMVLFWSA